MNSVNTDKMKDKFLLLQQQLQNMGKMEVLLSRSLAQCEHIELSNAAVDDLEILDKFEALTARFARFNDVLLQKVFRLIDDIDFDHSGTVRDRINRAEKKGLINDAREFMEIRELRNSIAHEYQAEALNIIFPQVVGYTPVLLEIADRVRKYCNRYDL